MNRRAILASAVAAPIVTLPIPALAAISPEAKLQLFQMAEYCIKYPPLQEWGCLFSATHDTGPIQELVSLGYLEFVEDTPKYPPRYNWSTTNKFLKEFVRI